jgi:cytochrome c oxidase subunit 4
MQAHTEEHHIVPIRVYVIVFLTLILLTWVTAWVSTVDLGPMNIYVALSIAIFKASIVALFFMHVKYSSRLTKLIVCSGILWLLFLLFVTMGDFWTRNWIGVPGR